MFKSGRTVVSSAVLMALTMLISPVRGQPPRGTDSDLDDLLGMIGQGGVVSNQMLSKKAGERSRESAWYVSGTVIAPPLQKKEELERLLNSRTREVAEAAKQLKPALEMLNRATAAEKNSKDLIAKLREQNAPSGDEISDAVAAYLSRLDPGDLDVLVAHRKITREEADEFLRRQGKAKADFLNKFTKSFGDTLQINTLTFQQTHRLRNRAEILQNKVVAEVLAPAVRTRAGQEQKSPPLQINWGLFTQFDQGLQWYDARINVRSTTAQELTRLTLLFEFQTTQGSRHATIYIPKLAPTGGGQFDPIALSWMYLNGPPKEIPKDLVEMNLENTRVRYSVWCDQFRAEGLELTALSREEMVNDIRLLALQPGLVYSSEGGQVLNPNKEAAKAPPPRGDAVLGGGGKSTTAPYKQEYEPDGRFELNCKKLTPVKRDYEVELELTDRTADPAKSKPQLLRGIVSLPAVKFDNAGHMISTEECRWKLMTGKQEFQMILVGQWRDGEWRWQAGKDLTASRRFNPDTIPAPSSPDAGAKERLRAAMVLFCDHKYAEAQQAYEKISADYPPDSRWNIFARRCISFLKEIDRTSDKSQQARAEAMQKNLDVRRGKSQQAPEEADKKTDSPLTKGRPSVAKSSDPPTRKTPDQPTRAPSKKDAASKRDESAKPTAGGTASATRVTVDDIEYEYLGLVRQGAKAIVTVRATSHKGDRAGTQGQITFTDDQGEKYYGTVEDPNLQLREGKPVKLSWRFGTNAFTGKSTAPPPKLTRFTLVSIVILAGGSNPTIEFHDVPATITKR